MNFFEFVAEEVREIPGRSSVSARSRRPSGTPSCWTPTRPSPLEGPGLDLSPVLQVPDAARYGRPGARRARQDHGLDHALDNTLIQLAEAALEDGAPGAAGTAGAQREPDRGHPARLRGDPPLRRRRAARDTIDVTLTGSAGQSFGAFLPRGITLRLVGDANDYVGKGLSGGRIIVRPARGRAVRRRAEHHRRQRDRLRRDRRRALPARPGRRAVLRAQLRRDRRRRGRRRPRARVHDRRPRRRARRRPAATSRAGMSGGIAYVLDLRPGRSTPTGRAAARSTPSDQAIAARAGRAARARDRFGGRGRAAGRLGAARRRSSPRCMPRDYQRVLERREQAEAEGRDVDAAIMEATGG